MAERFPILQDYRRPGRLQHVPWALAEAAREQARRNHGQSLEGLAGRGGLSVEELAIALLGFEWRWFASFQKAGFNAEEFVIRLGLAFDPELPVGPGRPTPVTKG